MYKIVLFMLIAALNASCAMHPPLSEARSSLEAKPVCCASFADMRFQPLGDGGKISFQLNAESEAFQFHEGKSFFAAYRLPVGYNELEVVLKSYYAGDVLYPVVTVLNSGHEVTRIIKDPTIRRVEPGLIESGHIGGRFIVTANNDERYLIVHTKSDFIGKRETNESSGYSYVAGQSFVFVPPTSYTHNYSPVGSLTLAIKRVN